MRTHRVMAEMMRKAYRVPDLTNRRILLAGLGGGCDIFTAHAFRHVLAGARAASFTFANAKRKGGCGSTQGSVSPHVLRSAAPFNFVNDDANELGPEATLLLVVPQREDEPCFVEEIRQLGCDFIFGIDAGGDSLVPSALSGSEGRDKIMLRLLRQTGVPLHHVVVAPGCDGEATADALAEAMSHEASRDRYRGCCSLEPLYADLQKIAVRLTRERTPCIMLTAAARLAAGGSEAMIVERGIWPEIPLAWLTRGFVFGEA